jgi:hypothetical protein
MLGGDITVSWLLNTHQATGSDRLLDLLYVLAATTPGKVASPVTAKNCPNHSAISDSSIFISTPQTTT